MNPIQKSQLSYNKAMAVTLAGVIMLIASAAIGLHIQSTSPLNHTWTTYDIVAGAGSLTAIVGVSMLYQAHKKLFSQQN